MWARAAANISQNLVIEDLNVAGMMQGKTPKSQADAGIGEIKRQTIYKGQWSHCNVQLAHRFYPSSKTCSNCQTVNAKLKREPSWQCSNCGTIHDRNINAAVTLRNLRNRESSGSKLGGGYLSNDRETIRRDRSRRKGWKTAIRSA